MTWQGELGNAMILWNENHHPIRDHLFITTHDALVNRDPEIVRTTLDRLINEQWSIVIYCQVLAQYQASTGRQPKALQRDLNVEAQRLRREIDENLLQTLPTKPLVMIVKTHDEGYRFGKDDFWMFLYSRKVTPGSWSPQSTLCYDHLTNGPTVGRVVDMIAIPSTSIFGKTTLPHTMKGIYRQMAMAWIQGTHQTFVIYCRNTIDDTCHSFIAWMLYNHLPVITPQKVHRLYQQPLTFAQLQWDDGEETKTIQQTRLLTTLQQETDRDGWVLIAENGFPDLERYLQQLDRCWIQRHPE